MPAAASSVKGPFTFGLGTKPLVGTKDAPTETRSFATWPDFVAWLRDEAPRHKVKDRSPWISAPMTGGRSRFNAQPRNWLPVDLEQCTPADMKSMSTALARANICGVAWPTHSDRPEAPRRRFILAASRVMTHDESAKVGKVLAAHLLAACTDDPLSTKARVDLSVFQHEQGTYLAPPGVDIVLGGEHPLDVDAMLAAWTDDSHCGVGTKSEHQAREVIYDAQTIAAAEEFMATLPPAADAPRSALFDEASVRQTPPLDPPGASGNYPPGFTLLLASGAVKGSLHSSVLQIAGASLAAGEAPDYIIDSLRVIIDAMAGPLRGPHEIAREIKDMVRTVKDLARKDAKHQKPAKPEKPGTSDEHSDTQTEADEKRDADGRKKSKEIAAGDDGDIGLLAHHKTKFMTSVEMCTRLVYVRHGARVAVRGGTDAHPISDMRSNFIGSKDKLTLPDGRAKFVSAFDRWHASAERTTVATVTFAPGKPEITLDPEGHEALNTWRAYKRGGRPKASVKAFIDHVAYLVPVKAERERFLDWLAHIEQCPGVLPHTHFLMVTPQTGIGRNWLASCLARVWPGASRLGFDLAATLSNGFNGMLSRRLFAVVDELKSTGADHSQAFKSMLTTEQRTINPKFGRQHVEFNRTRFLMLSQHFDALPLEKADRRVIVIANPTERKSVAHYTALYAKLDDSDFVAAVAYWLSKRNISAYDASEPAPLSEAKRRALSASESDAETVLNEIREASTCDLVTSAQVNAELLKDGVRLTGPRARRATYDAAGFVRCEQPLKVRGQDGESRISVLAMRNHEQWRKAPAGVLRDELERGGWGSTTYGT